MSLGEENKNTCTVSNTKHPASVMSLGFIASNSEVKTLIWFPPEYRLTARNYKAQLADKFVPWTNNTSAMSSVNAVLQQKGAPAHTFSRVYHFLQEQNFSFWSKIMWPPYSPDANSLDYAFWPHIETRACNVPHPNITALRTSVIREWRVMSRDYDIKSRKAFIRCLEGIIASDGGYIE